MNDTKKVTSTRKNNSYQEKQYKADFPHTVTLFFYINN